MLFSENKDLVRWCSQVCCWCNRGDSALPEIIRTGQKYRLWHDRKEFTVFSSETPGIQKCCMKWFVLSWPPAVSSLCLSCVWPSHRVQRKTQLRDKYTHVSEDLLVAPFLHVNHLFSFYTHRFSNTLSSSYYTEKTVYMALPSLQLTLL